MLPIRDDNPTLRTPVATYALIALNVAAWLLVQGMGSEPQLSGSICSLGLIPGEFPIERYLSHPRQSSFLDERSFVLEAQVALLR